MWFLPTYGRPARCQEALDSIIKAGCKTPGLVVVDGDGSDGYADLRLPGGWQLVRLLDKRRGLLATLNYMFESYPNEPWYGYLNDDFIVHTPGWDEALIVAAGLRGMSNSNDGNWQSGKRMAGGLCFGGDFLRALGWWSPPGLWHCYADDTWEAVARAVDNWKTVSSILIEHRHVFNHKAADDATYRVAYSKFDQDKEAFEKFKAAGGLTAAIERVRALFAPEIELGRKRLERARTRSVMICTPIARDPVWQYTLALYDTGITMMQQGIKHCVQTVIGSSNLPRARNELVARFLASRCTDMIFIDDDMSWSPQAIIRLLASEQPIIGAAGRKRVDKPNTDVGVWCAHFPKNAEMRLIGDGHGAIEVVRVGTGFLKISREALLHLIALHPEWKKPGRSDLPKDVRDNYYHFFRFSDDDELGEDFAFCDRWRDAGGRVWIDPEIHLGHVGTKEYGGAIIELMSDVEPAAQEAA
jgi:glycosyltransferase involved in cell wall biosynthesis